MTLAKQQQLNLVRMKAAKLTALETKGQIYLFIQRADTVWVEGG